MPISLEQLEGEIRRRLAAYLSGQDSLQELQDWVGAHTWHLHPSDGPAADLAFEILLRLAEYSNGDWTEDELRGMFRPLLASPALPQSG